MNVEDIFADLELDFGIFKAIILHYKVVVMYYFFIFLLENTSANNVFISHHRRVLKSDRFVLLRLDNIRSELCNVWTDYSMESCLFIGYIQL